MGDYNLQCLVISREELDQCLIVSADGMYDIAFGTIAFGYFQEEFGMHFVSIDSKMSISNATDSHSNRHFEDFHSFKSSNAVCVCQDRRTNKSPNKREKL